MALVKPAVSSRTGGHGFEAAGIGGCHVVAMAGMITMGRMGTMTVGSHRVGMIAMAP